MPDVFTNAKPYFDIQFPSSGDGFSISGFRNQFLALGFLDFIPCKPVATGRSDRKIGVRGQDASSYFTPVYYGDNNQRVFFNSGDTPIFDTPSAGKQRIDIVFITPSGDILIHKGPEVVTATDLPSFGGSGDTRLPVCAVLNKSTQNAIWEFQDKDSHSGDGYILKDLRPWLRFK